MTFRSFDLNRFGSLIAGAMMLCTASVANAMPALDFDVAGAPESSVTISNEIGFCFICSVSTTLAPGLDDEIFSLQSGQSRHFDFFDISIFGIFGVGAADISAKLAFDLPPGTSVTGSGSGSALFAGIFTLGSLIWDSVNPPIVTTVNGSTFSVSLHDVNLSSFGPFATATVAADVTAINVVSEISEPGTLAIMGLGLVGLGFARRKRMI